MGFSMQKIVFLVTKASFGGAQRYVYDLATRMPRDTFEPIVGFGAPGILGAMVNEAGIRTVSFPSLGRDVHATDDLKSLYELFRFFNRERPDIVHLNSSKAAGLGGLTARLAGVPRIIFTIHGLPQDEPRGMLARQAIAFMTWLTGCLAHVVICISEDNLARVRQWPLVGQKAVLVRNGITPFSVLPAQEARAALRLPLGVTVVGVIAELTRNKGLDTLLRALALVPDTHACIIGEGELRAHLGTLARTLGLEDRVHFAGYQTDARRYLSAFDIFCLPSRKEGLPYAIFEAGLAKIPVVASDLPGVREIIADAGSLVSPDEPQALARALSDLLGDAETRDRMSNLLAERVKELFSIETMLRETLKAY